MKRKLVTQDINPTIEDENIKRLKTEQHHDEFIDTSRDTYSHSSESLEITESPEKIASKQQYITDEYILGKAKEGDMDFVKKNLEKVINIDKMDQQGNSLLHYAIYNNDLELVKSLKENGADLNNTNHEYATAPVLLAARLDEVDFSILKFLVDNKADLNIKNEYNYNILHKAAYCKDSMKLEFLLSLPIFKTMINEEGNWGGTPIENAIRTHNTKNVMLLLEKGAEITFSSLSVAVYRGDIEMLNFLSQQEVNWNIRSKNGDNLLHIATISRADKAVKSNDIAKFLVNIGVSTYEQNNEGLTPLGAYEKQKLDNFYDIPYNSILYDSDSEL